MAGLIRKRYGFIPAALLVVLCGLFGVFHVAAAEERAPTRTCQQENLYCISEKLAVGTERLRTLPDIPVVLPPVPVSNAALPAAGNVTVAYSVETRGDLTASVAEFKAQASQTLNDSRGWAQLGITFQEVANGSFTLVLATAEQVPSFAPGACSALYSCRVGQYVIINEDRWLGATPSWNQAGGSLRNYRHMVINHEAGHWLGHGHAYCSGPGQPAPVMQQQSIDLQGCRFNPWPLSSELHAPGLGI